MPSAQQKQWKAVKPEPEQEQSWTRWEAASTQAGPGHPEHRPQLLCLLPLLEPTAFVFLFPDTTPRSESVQAGSLHALLINVWMNALMNAYCDALCKSQFYEYKHSQQEGAGEGKDGWRGTRGKASTWSFETCSVVHAMEVSPCPPFTYTKAAVTSNHADTLLIAFLLQSYSTLAITHTKW